MATTTPNRGYQLPAAENKLKDDVLRLVAALLAVDADVDALLQAMADKANVGHGHAIEAITGLVTALGNKMDLGYHDALANLTDVDVAGVANGMALLRQASKWIPVALQVNNVAGLEAALSGKASVADINAAISALVNGSSASLDTLKELADALAGDPNFAGTMATALGNRLRVDASQVFSEGQKSQGRANLGVVDMASAIAGATDSAFVDTDMVPARRADGSLIQRAWSNTKSALNTYFKGLASVAVAAGDLIIGTGANTLSRLAAGTNGYILTMSGGAPAWAAAPSSGVPIATSYTLPVGASAFCKLTLGSAIAAGATVAGSNVQLAAGTNGYNSNPLVLIGSSATQSGTWRNDSNATLNGNSGVSAYGFGYFTRIS